MNEPSLERWKALYDAAIRFRDLAPWKWMEDCEIFGVRDPVSGTIGYCVVMGALGEHLALGVYRGTSGLQALMERFEGPPPEMLSPAELLAAQDCLMASFEDREFVAEEDRGVMKALGRRFRGRKAWPLFRSYEPGAIPWFLTDDEARFLTVCLEQVLEVAPRLRETPDLLPDASPLVSCLVRVPDTSVDPPTWSDALLPPDPWEPTPPDVAPLAADVLARLDTLAALPATNGILEMGSVDLPEPVAFENDPRPRLPTMVLAVPANPPAPEKGKGRRKPVAEAGPVAAMQMGPPSTLATLAVVALCDALETLGMLPAVVAVGDEGLLAFLGPAAARLGVRLEAREELPTLDATLGSLMGMMGGLDMGWG